MSWRRSEALILGRATIGDILDAIVTAAPLATILDGGVLRLFTNNPVIDPDFDPANFVEATFVGYAAETPLVFSAVGNVDPVGRLVHVEANFVAGAIVAPGETVLGYWCENAGGTQLFFAEKFATPVQFVNNGDFLSLDVVLELPYIWPVTPEA